MMIETIITINDNNNIDYFDKFLIIQHVAYGIYLGGIFCAVIYFADTASLCDGSEVHRCERLHEESADCLHKHLTGSE